jgi:hypothetical protein
MGGKEGGSGAVGTAGKGASADPDDYYDVEADDEPCRLPGRTVLATVCLYLTFVAMGFGTGWSSIDSVFQELNKFIEKYDDLKFASDLVFASSCAASMVLVLAFLGLYCNPSKYDLRTLGFFEGTISTVLIVSCCVQFILMNFWQESRYVVLACSFMGATIGNIQGFIIYPFFNAFYRLELIAYMNMGETLTSMACGSLALLQSPTVGVENFTVSTYFTVLFYATCTAGAAWSSLGWQTGYRRDADEVDSPQDLSSTASPRVLSDDDTDHPERKPLLQKIESGGSEVGGGSGGEQVWTAGGVMTRGPHGMTTPAKEVRSARKQKPMQKLRGLYTNVVGVLGREGTHLRSLLAISGTNSVLTWTVLPALLPFTAAAVSGSCETDDPISKGFIRMCTSLSSMIRVIGPLMVRSDGKMWGNPNVVKIIGFCGICLNLMFCIPAFFPDPDGHWQTLWGKLFLMVAYFLTTPVETFVQLHLLINTQRENAGSSKRIIDAGFFFTALWVLSGFIVSELLQQWTLTGTAACPGMNMLADTGPKNLPFNSKELDKDYEARAIQDEQVSTLGYLFGHHEHQQHPLMGPTWFNLF